MAWPQTARGCRVSRAKERLPWPLLQGPRAAAILLPLHQAGGRILDARKEEQRPCGPAGRRSSQIRQTTQMTARSRLRPFKGGLGSPEDDEANRRQNFLGYAVG